MTDWLIHGAGLVLAFVSVSIGSYGLLRQLSSLGLLPVMPGAGRSLYGELGHRIGELADQRGWFRAQRAAAARDLKRARVVDTEPEDFVGNSALNAIVAGVVVWLITQLLGGSPMNVIPAAVAVFVAFQVPAWNLKGRSDLRVSQISKRLPYSLEVIVLATESGAGFEEALAILVREDPGNPLHEEFDQVLRDAELGRKRRESLHAMLERVKTEDLAALVMALDISEELGTPIGETLKKQSEVIKSNRLARAERLAREAGPKMAVPNTMIMVANVLLILAPFLPKLNNFSGV